jgi:cytochrome c-type biogenesis protein CcmE
MTNAPKKTRRKNRNLKWTIGLGVVFLIIIGLSLNELNSNSVYFFTPKEAKDRAPTIVGQTVKVGGMVKPGSVEWEPKALSLKFTLSNLKDTEIQVAHIGTPPDMFKEGQGVIVEGQLDKEGLTMKSKTLMVKHSEEYQKPEDHYSQEPELLKKSIFKDSY